MSMPSFELAADQILELIEAERIDACAALHEQMVKAEAQSTAFRKTAYTTHAANEEINAQCNRDIIQLTKTLHGLQQTLRQAGIYYSQGQLTFGQQWGAVVRGFRPSSSRVPPPSLTPQAVVYALETQRQENDWWRSRDPNQVLQVRQQLAARQDNAGVYEMNAADANAYMPILPSPDIDTKLSLKRKLGMAPEASDGFATKRCRPTDYPPDVVWGTNPGFNPPPTFSPRVEDNANGVFKPGFNPPCPTYSTQTACTPPVAAPVSGPPSNTPLSVCQERLLAPPPALERWRCALIIPSIEARSPPECILPPLSTLVGAHACSYYMWFAIRSFLFRRMSEPQPIHVRTALSTEEWEIKLHNRKRGDDKDEYVYNETSFAKDGAPCACGMPPLDSKILRKLTLRADGSPIQAGDFAARALQELICADLALAHAKLQLEQTDDAVLDGLAWSADQRAQRVEARRDIFRNSWDRSFAPAPLELPDILARRPWIFRFRDLLQAWPNFGASTAAPLPTGEDTDALYLDALVACEQRLIAFYLQTVSDTLGAHPARPMQRPDANALPELYRHIVSSDHLATTHTK